MDGIKLNLGLFIVGYSGENQKYLDSFIQWERVFDNVKVFTDSRLGENTRVWLELGAIDLATLNIPILDWYVKMARDYLNEAQYITYYSDFCRWYVIYLLNELYENDINGFCQATYLYVPEPGKTPEDLKRQLKGESMDHFVIYGNDRNFMLDGEIKLRILGHNFIKRICFGFDISYKYLLSIGHFENFNIYPIEKMIKVSINNPDYDENQIRAEWVRKLSDGWMPTRPYVQEMLESTPIEIDQKKLKEFITTLPNRFAGQSFVVEIKDYKNIKIIYPEDIFAPFFTRMEVGDKHWSKGGGKKKRKSKKRIKRKSKRRKPNAKEDNYHKKIKNLKKHKKKKSKKKSNKRSKKG